MTPCQKLGWKEGDVLIAVDDDDGGSEDSLCLGKMSWVTLYCDDNSYHPAVDRVVNKYFKSDFDSNGFVYVYIKQLVKAHDYFEDIDNPTEDERTLFELEHRFDAYGEQNA